MVNSHICHCVLKRDHIPPLKGYAQALDQKRGFFPWFLSDDIDALIDLLHQLDSHCIPCCCHLCVAAISMAVGQNVCAG